MSDLDEQGQPLSGTPGGSSSVPRAGRRGGGSMRKLLTEGAVANPLPVNGIPAGVNGTAESVVPGPMANPAVVTKVTTVKTRTATPRRPASLLTWLFPIFLLLMLIAGAGLLGYSLGSTRGKENANFERDKFLESRVKSWQATATAQATANTVPSADITPGAKPGYNLPNAILARVDQLEGEKLTVLPLDSAGQPSGATLVVMVSKQTAVWRNIPSETTEIKAGDFILFSGERNDKGDFNARSIVILAG